MDIFKQKETSTEWTTKKRKSKNADQTYGKMVLVIVEGVQKGVEKIHSSKSAKYVKIMLCNIVDGNKKYYKIKLY